MTDPAKSYGEGRIRSNVSYADVERAAIAILKSGRRPTVETIREALGGGSPDTIGDALRRFWRDLGARMEGDPAALSRMPAEIADIADGMWQRALALAASAAKNDDNAARERLNQLQMEVEIRQRSFELREREIDEQARARERALSDARDHLLSISRALSREQAHTEGLQARVEDLDRQVEQFRSQIGSLIAGAITRGRTSSNVTRLRAGLTTKRSKRKAPATLRRPPPPRRISKKAAPKKRIGSKDSRTPSRSKARPRKH